MNGHTTTSDLKMLSATVPYRLHRQVQSHFEQDTSSPDRNKKQGYTAARGLVT